MTTSEPRSIVASLAKCEFDEWFAKWIERHDISYGEIMWVLGAAMCSWAKWQIRDERR